jgi:methyl-accepting chemotaxis protein
MQVRSFFRKQRRPEAARLEAPPAPAEPASTTTSIRKTIDLLELDLSANGILPQIQEPILASDKRMVFCAAVDRNGYLPVHNDIYSLPQRPGEVLWNTAHSRNRCIFDDRAGLSAGRVIRPYIIQNYPRDMGDRVVMMWEIGAPIRVFGKQWGGLRTAYTL